MTPCDVIMFKMCKSELINNLLRQLGFLGDQSNSSVEHSQFIFYLYDHVEYLAQRCDYAARWSASPSIIK